MRIELPAPPTRLGCSKRVRRRVRESVPAVRVAFASLEILGEAVDRRWGDRIAEDGERWQREILENSGTGDKAPTVTDLVYGIGCQIRDLAASMVEADEALDRTRRHRRHCARRRDDVRRDLYGLLSRLRKHARGIVGRREARYHPELRGETVRDPWMLIRQTEECLRWAASRDDAPAGAGDWTPMTSPLVLLRDQLNMALRIREAAEVAVPPALDLRDRAIVEFDDRYLKGARLLERLYVLLGLPSLAAAVRPHRKITGRVGRPSKKPESDRHPDLVERVLARLSALPAS